MSAKGISAKVGNEIWDFCPIFIKNEKWRLKDGNNRRNTQIKEKAKGNC